MNFHGDFDVFHVISFAIHLTSHNRRRSWYGGTRRWELYFYLLNYATKPLMENSNVSHANSLMHVVFILACTRRRWPAWGHPEHAWEFQQRRHVRKLTEFPAAIQTKSEKNQGEFNSQEIPLYCKWTASVFVTPLFGSSRNAMLVAWRLKQQQKNRRHGG